MVLNNQSGFLLSPQQQQIVRLQQAGLPSAYRTVCTVRLYGVLDEDRLRQSIDDLAGRYEILRTTFPARPGLVLPLQVVVDDLAPQWQRVDLSHLDDHAAAEQTIRLFQEECFRQSPPDQESPLRLTLIQLAPEHQVLLMSLPALCADASSLDQLLAELSRSYAELPAPDDEAPVQYADLATLFQEWLDSDETSAGRAYWQGYRLEDAAIAPTLPGERQSSRDRPPHVRTTSSILPSGLGERLQSLAAHYQVTFSTLVLAGWCVLLQRLTQQTDLVVATTFSGRTYEELENAAGLLERSLPVRCSIKPTQHFADLLPPIQRMVDELAEWQDYYNPEWVQRHVPQGFFGIAFGHRVSRQRYDGGALQFVKDRCFSCTDRYSLKLELVQADAQVLLDLYYDAERFTEAQAERWTAVLINLLDAIAQAPETQVDRLALLSPREQHKLISTWNQTTANFPNHLCLHQLFEAQAIRTPDHVAVIFEEQRLSYRELNDRAEQLARHLQAAGVGPDMPVGLLVTRSPDMPVGLLAILKAGGAVLPLDPSYPRGRLTFMLEDAQVGLLLMQQQLTDLVPDYQGAIVYLDQPSGDIGPSDLPGLPAVAPENTACIIYTSGSTGTPKGVMLTHQGLVNRIWWGQQQYPLDEQDGVLQITSLSFDFALWEIFAPLCVGAHLVLPRLEGHLDSAYLARLIAGEQVTVLHFVPSLLRLFLQEPSLAEYRHSVRLVFSGGEPLPIDLQQRFFDLFSATLYNQYGPTETSIDVTYWQCRPEQSRERVPIGYPIHNTQIYLLDTQMQPVPIGVPGEIYIGGVGVARGYLSRPDTTAEHFLPDPFAAQRGARLYRSGDLARYAEDGAIEFLGRADDQIKIRGNRIELGEIESTLLRYPDVQQAVAAAWEDGTQQKQLIAYVVAAPEQALDEQALLSWMRKQVPDFMVPSMLVPLENVPHLPNGKIDRRALPKPEHAGKLVVAPYEPPRNVLEEQLCATWAEVLGVAQVGISDNFFDLGGHSLLAMQLVLRLRSWLEVEISVRDLFDAPTVAQLAERVETLQWMLQPADEEGEYEEGIIFSPQAPTKE